MNPHEPATRPNDCGDLVPWDDLSDGQRQRFLAAYGTPAACAERAQHATGTKSLRFFAMLKELSLVSPLAIETIKENLALLRTAHAATGEPTRPDFLAQEKAVEESLNCVTNIRASFERKIGDTLLDWVRERDWKALEWLTALVKRTPEGEFKEENVCTPQSTDLKSVMVHAFVKLSDCSELSLLYGAEPYPERLPTKKAFDLYVMERYEWKGRGKNSADNFGKQIQLCRKTLGLDGLPETSDVK